MRDALILRVSTTKPMHEIAPGVLGLRTVMVNVFAIEAEDGWVLVDAGLPGSAAKIIRWADQNFGRDNPPRAIVLTHGHFDHVGALAALCDKWDSPVYAHPMEMPYLTGQSKYPPPDPTVGGGAMAFMASLYPRGPIDVSPYLRELPEDGSIPELPGWRWVATPGHTAGHVSLFRDSDRVLLAGDAFVTTKQESLLAVATQRPEIHGPPAYYTSDWEAAKLSVARLAGLFPQVMATGHGRPVYGTEAARALEALADDFDDLARPVRGRYVGSPALVSERGVISVPPSRGNPLLVVAGGLAFVGAWYWIARRGQRRQSAQS
jgi:glyoxylase-like metal-dependent hydrolase (beta-lactamase superfamily II)